MRLRYALGAAGLTAATLLATSLPADATWTAASSAATTRSAAKTLPAGGTPSENVAGATVTSTWPALTVASGVAVRGYRVTRYNASTGTSATPGGTCTGVVTATSCQDTSVPDGRWKYAVQAVHGTNWVGTAGSQSASVLVSTTAGVVAVSFPKNTRYNNAGQWTGCTPNPGFCGTASPAGGTTLTAVRVSLRLGTAGNFWNPTTGKFDSSAEVLLPVTGTLPNWQVAFPFGNLPNNSSFSLRVVEIDDGGAAQPPEVVVPFTT